MEDTNKDIIQNGIELEEQKLQARLKSYAEKLREAQDKKSEN
jgi:hypothetical protein